ncbi:MULTISPECIES: GyrI-like domain-containing protein [unclassified Duganella]|jgi:DNA gyrase inhibitor GyrI|uniref:AraC family transcriptional regulator n=1 Tax=unclassified Duganella TaxID=2636909 RepID=UPI00088DA027|nr:MULTISPECIES: GyrI-like domain-containing protein [unclassified Duganella]SDF96059.1 DNA gyrase inhibitor GyrI [Duganella sp. OV458]SDJ08707.1 AraC family transcriptional regulator [Duganella sp. OV510]
MHYEIKELPEVRVAYLRYKGPFGPALGEFWKEVFTPWQQAFGLTGKVTYGVAQDDPASTPPSECRYDACVEIAPDYVLKPPAKETHLPAGRYAVAPFKGTAGDVPKAWGAFFGQLSAEGKVDEGLCFERYPADYAMDPATGIFTAELCIPVKA